MDRLTDARGLYEALLAAHGPQGWWPGGRGFSLPVGAILVQHTTWASVERALDNLRGAGLLDPPALAAADPAAVAELVRPAGLPRQKAERLTGFARALVEDFGGSLELLYAAEPHHLHAWLLARRGIGRETAESVMLYGARLPVPVVDAYARRIVRRLGLAPDGDADAAWREWFAGQLPADATLLGELHALLVEHGKRFCRVAPRCTGCPLRACCPVGRQRTAGALPAEEVSV